MLSYYFPAKEGDTIGRVLWKKKAFLWSCRQALRKNPKWRHLTKDERWERVRQGSWPGFLPERLRMKYEQGRQGERARIARIVREIKKKLERKE